MKNLCAAIALLLPTAAAAECAEREAALAALDVKYQETQQVIGYAPSETGGFIMELYANTETGTWTVLATQPSGMVCVVAFGEDYQVVPQGEPM